MRSQAEWLEMNNRPVAGLILENEHKVEHKPPEAAVGEWAAFIEKEIDQDRWMINQRSPLVSEESGCSIKADHTGRPSRWCLVGVRH